jgi:hypothetical protein
VVSLFVEGSPLHTDLPEVHKHCTALIPRKQSLPAINLLTPGLSAFRGDIDHNRSGCAPARLPPLTLCAANLVCAACRVECEGNDMALGITVSARPHLFANWHDALFCLCVLQTYCCLQGGVRGG